MKIMLLSLVLILLCGCGTGRSKYNAYRKGEGYREQEVEAGLQSASFRGNKHTSKTKSQLFARFRAIEICRESQQLAHVLAVSDRSQVRDITRTSSHGFGPGFYHGMGMGMHPFWGRHPGFGFHGGFHSMQADSWRETLIYPEIAVVFQCEKSIFEPMLSLREVPAEEMKILVRDLKGALQIERVLPGSPNQGKLLNGDIILKLEGERVQTILELLRLVKGAPGKALATEIFRDGERMRVNMHSADVTEAIRQTQQEVIARACKQDDVKERPICRE
jgi:hypothetical protein